MVFKKVVTAVSAIALIASPTIAVAQSAAPVEPASESVEGSELRGGFIIPGVALILVILAIIILLKDDEDRVSP